MAEDVKLPSKRQLEKKAAQLESLITQPFTEVCLLFMTHLSSLKAGSE